MFWYGDAWSLISTGDTQPTPNPTKEPLNFSSSSSKLQGWGKSSPGIHQTQTQTIRGAWLVSPQNSDKAVSTPPNVELTVEHPAGMIFHEPSHCRGNTLQHFSERFRTTPFFASPVPANVDCVTLLTCDRPLIETSDINDQERRPNISFQVVNFGMELRNTAWEWAEKSGDCRCLPSLQRFRKEFHHD